MKPQKIEGVKIARAVAGRFDVALYIEDESIEKVIEKIQSIKWNNKVRDPSGTRITLRLVSDPKDNSTLSSTISYTCPSE